MGSVGYGDSVAVPRVAASAPLAPLGGVTESVLESGRGGCGPNHLRWGFSLRTRHLGSRAENTVKNPKGTQTTNSIKRSCFILVSSVRPSTIGVPP